jgi:hypothetical protein
MRKLVIAAWVAAVAAVACATLTPRNATDSIQRLQNADGACTAWSVGPGYWVTTKHCFVMGGWDGWEIAGGRATVIAVAPNADLAILSGPVARAIPVAELPPPLGARVMTYGYGMNQRALLWFDARIVSNGMRFFDGTIEDEMIVSGANGMPGMSGGPVIYQGEAVGVVSGGGMATMHTHLIGAAVTWRALHDFTQLHVGR